FCTARNKNWDIVDYGENQEFTDFFIAEEVSPGKWKTPRQFSEKLNTKFNEGPFTFNKDTTIIYYTGNVDLGKKKLADSKQLHIYQARKKGNDWDDIESLSLNNDKYSTGHPALSPDNKKLYFVSNMPGGFGGTDIYVSYLHNGVWTKPVNLGDKINTSGNELFPFISFDGMLYFSSDGHTGLGKLDIFSAQFLEAEWKNVKNLGAPFNSLHDDFSFVAYEKEKYGYFSSDRGAGNTGDDIYKFSKIESECDSLIPKTTCFTFFETGTLHNDSLPLFYEWDLGDGNTKRGLEVNHCYAGAGEYTIQLNVMDSIRKEIFFNEATYKITVEEITTPYIEVLNEPMLDIAVVFEGRRSKLKGCKINEYIWDFGDGINSIGPKVSHHYQGYGTYEVNLLVRGDVDSTGKDFEACVYKKIEIKNPADKKVIAKDSASSINDIAQTVYTVKGKENVVYKVEVARSNKHLAKESDVFKGLQDIKEYNDNGIYGYTVGENTDLELTYPLYSDIKEKGFNEAHVVAFQNGNVLRADTLLPSNQQMASTIISGRVMSRFGDPLGATIVLEELSTGKIISKIQSSGGDGRYSFRLTNNEIYGYYAELDSFYSVSNHIDLRNEKRNLDVKKNIEMISVKELNEENLSLRINNLFFATDKNILARESFPELKRLAKLVKFEKDLIIEISGHTDNQGNGGYNLDLSQRRADAVKEYLISLGCYKDKIITKGYGFSKPLVSNNTEKGRYLNRRVEIRFLSNK
ncbi:MAG TPA: PKD domain-containing protein, partial [Cytophagaceae bacterium]